MLRCLRLCKQSERDHLLESIDDDVRRAQECSIHKKVNTCGSESSGEKRQREKEREREGENERAGNQFKKALDPRQC